MAAREDNVMLDIDMDRMIGEVLEHKDAAPAAVAPPVAVPPVAVPVPVAHAPRAVPVAPQGPPLEYKETRSGPNGFMVIHTDRTSRSFSHQQYPECVAYIQQLRRGNAFAVPEVPVTPPPPSDIKLTDTPGARYFQNYTSGKHGYQVRLSDGSFRDFTHSQERMFHEYVALARKGLV